MVWISLTPSKSDQDYYIVIYTFVIPFKYMLYVFVYIHTNCL